MTIENTDEYKEWLREIQQDGTALRSVPEAMRTEALCLAAVQQNGLELQLTPESRRTETVCLVAVQEFGTALQHVPEVLRTEAICLAAVQQNGYALEYVIRPADQLSADAQQLASWNRILMQVDETDYYSKKHLQSQLIKPLLAQFNKAQKLTAPVVDEIAILIEHCERLEIDIEPVKELYCKKQQLAKPQSKYKKSVSPEHTL